MIESWQERDPATLRIVRYPDPVLRKPCEPITEFTPRLAAIIDRMFAVMADHKGIGLAAPQVGLPIQLFVCNAGEDDTTRLVCINPRLSEPGDPAEAEEGCLSLPGVSVPMLRPRSITLTAHDQDGTEYVRQATELWARVIQHETDHLHGRLIIDRMPPAIELENRRAIRQLEDEFQRRRK